MKRHLAALVLAALAVLGIQRLPCLLGGVAQAVAPPCHGGPPAPEEPPAGCTQCEGVHRLVATAAADLDASPPLLSYDAPAWRPLAPRPGRAAIARGVAGRAPDPLRTSTVRLL